MRLQQSAAAWVVSPPASEIADGTRRRSLSLQLELMLASGGDERIWPDPLTGRNRYGTSVAPAAHEIWFSSSTASATSFTGYRAASEALTALLGSPPLAMHEFFASIRARILRTFGIPGAAAILTASGTEAELMTLAVARTLLGGRLTNMLIAPHETGSGVPNAAAGKHFLTSAPHQSTVERGLEIEGVLDVDVVSVALRHRDGGKRSCEEVDNEVLARAAGLSGALLLHILDTSKTGLSGPSPAIARTLTEAAPGRVLVAVDACQLRCSAEKVRAYLDDGFMVLLTGSKFLGGAPFSGCLLLPPVIAAALAEAPPAPAGLAAYNASFDVPQRLRGWFAHGFGAVANIGLGLRWTTALAELDRYEAVREALRSRILATFIEKVRARASSTPWLQGDPPGAPIDPYRGSIVTLVIEEPRRGPLSMQEVAVLYRRMREPCPDLVGDAICHLGQPVAVGDKAALRICASAPLVSDIAERLAAGLSFETAFAPVTRDLDTLFRKWARLVG